MKLDILVIAAHPDDAEIGCAGTILSHIAMGRSVGVIDLTEGELGTRGSGPLRLLEAEEASRRMGLAIRENMGFRDGFFLNDEQHQMALVEKIRFYQPNIVLANAIHDRHPDHGRASQLISQACFLSGLRKVETSHDSKTQDAWRPLSVYHFVQDYHIKPDFVVDISAWIEQKIEVMLAYKSQFHDPNSTEPQTVLSTPDFMERIRSRAREFGKFSDSGFGEGYTAERMPAVRNLFDLR